MRTVVVANVASFIFEWLPDERVVVVYQGKHEPEDTEWDAYIDLVRSLQGSGTFRVLACSEGGRATREQQQRLMTVDMTGWLVAVVSPSTAVRFVVSRFALEIPAIKVFSPDQVNEACTYLGCNSGATAAILAARERLRLTLEASATNAGAPNPRQRIGTRLLRTEPQTNQADPPSDRRGEGGTGTP